MKLQDLLTQLFPDGCNTVTTGWLVSGEAVVAGKTVSVIGTTDHTFIGVREIVALSEKFLDIAERFPGRPIIMLVDNNGQRMALDEELLALPEYVAHLLKELSRSPPWRDANSSPSCTAIRLPVGLSASAWARIASSPCPAATHL
jgi:hypothetical protein